MRYEKPDALIVILEDEDVIRTSSTNETAPDEKDWTDDNVDDNGWL